MALKEILDKIDAGGILDRDEISFLLSLSDPAEVQVLFKKAYEMKVRHVGKVVYFRGIVEFSNICEKDCLYCGIRRSSRTAKRFLMSEDEIVAAALWAYGQDYGSVVLQSGERGDNQFVDHIERCLRRIKKESDGKLGITLSVGEQTEETYRRWFEAGAHRYLLRIETSSPELYKRLHPPDHSWDARRKCLDLLRKVGYQVGTGVMIGLPGQTLADLANDIVFFRELDVDMVGMGPYIVHDDTPLAALVKNYDGEAQLTMALKMIAVARLVLKDVNIASTTALQSLRHDGREMGILAGANIIMPNVTETKYRPLYQLYKNKPCLDENSSMCRNCLQARIEKIGEKIGFGEWGDSPHFRGV